jgi:hypothetical protein
MDLDFLLEVCRQDDGSQNPWADKALRAYYLATRGPFTSYVPPDRVGLYRGSRVMDAHEIARALRKNYKEVNRTRPIMYLS